MSLSEQTKLLATTVAGAAALAFLITRLQGPAEEVVKRGLVDKLENVGRLSASATAAEKSFEDNTYDFIIIGGGKLSHCILRNGLPSCNPVKKAPLDQFLHRAFRSALTSKCYYSKLELGASYAVLESGR